MSRTDVVLKKKTQYEQQETNYRKMEGLNYSSIKLYDKDPARFYEEYVLGNKDDEGAKSFPLIMGDLCDFYLLDCHMNEQEFDQRLDEKFAMMEGEKSSAQVFTLTDEIFKIYRTCEEGTFVFSDAIIQAFDCVQKDGKYKNKTVDAGLKEFNEKGGKDYLDTLIANRGKTVVDDKMVAKAKKMVNQLRMDENHGDFINQHTNDGVEVLKKVVVQFEYMGVKCKCEIDFMHIYHNDRKIYLRDLKTTFDNDSFDDTYLKQYYYLQNGFYTMGAIAFAEQHNLKKYIVEPTAFLVLDTSKYSRRPLLYTTTQQHVEDGLYGFTARGRYRKGVNQLMEELQWSMEENIWDISKENYENRGVIHLKDY